MVNSLTDQEFWWSFLKRIVREGVGQEVPRTLNASTVEKRVIGQENAPPAIGRDLGVRSVLVLQQRQQLEELEAEVAIERTARNLKKMAKISSALEEPSASTHDSGQSQDGIQVDGEKSVENEVAT